MIDVTVKELLNKHKQWLEGSQTEERVKFKQVYLGGADLRGADLRGADLRDANFRGADLEGANLEDADLEEANLVAANLKGANLQGASLQGANLESAYLMGANLEDANLRDAYLEDAYLREANFGDANFVDADIRDADFRGADLRRADFQGADLRGADLRGTDLRGADLRGADLSETLVGGGDRGKGLSPEMLGLPPANPSIADKVKELVLANNDCLNMGLWHSCDTQHCLAGWAIHLMGEDGYELEQRYSPSVAGAIIAPTLQHLFYGNDATTLEALKSPEN